MKKAVVALVAALGVLIVLMFMLLDERTGSNTLVLDGSDDDAAATQPTVGTQDTVPDASSATPGPAGPSSPAPPVPADARAASVDRVADGDSFEIVWADSGESDELRLLGINAPELDACFGDAALGVLELLTMDSDLQVDVVGRDDFDRGLANVWVDDGASFVNARMVELGAALALSDGGEHAELLADLQQLARDLPAGLWDPTFCGPSEGATVRIAHIESDAPGPDNENPNGEWIEIFNEGDASVDLTGWSIRDESTSHRFAFPDDFTLGPDATVVVYSGCGTDADAELFWCDGDPVWNNGGDTGFLVDADGHFVDTLSY